MSPLIDIQNVSRVYGKGEAEVRALDGVSLTIKAGEFVAIVGQSGSGKSTLMNILGCLDRPTSGVYSVREKNVSTLTPDELAALRRDTFGFVFQRYNLLTSVSAAENVEMPAIYAGGKLEERRNRAQALLEKLGLGDRGQHRPNELSGGQQQRVAVARALINDAEVILADEPTGALDSSSGSELLGLLEELHAAGRTIILITHDHNVAARAHRIVELADGKIISDTGETDDLKTVKPFEKTVDAPTWFLQASEAVKMAFRSLRANLFRTSLTLLGVVIGVAAVVAMLAIGEGSSKQVVASIETMGSNLLFVRPGAPGTRMRGSAIATLTMEDAARLAEIDNIVAAIPTRSGRETLRVDSADYQTSIDGVSYDWPLAQNWDIAYGAFFTEDDQARRGAVVVLGYTVADNLFENVASAVGEYVFIGGAPFEVAGVLAPKGATAWGQDMDDVALAPITTGMMRLFGQNYLSSITIAVGDTKHIAETEAAAHALLLSRHGVEDFQLRNTASILESVEETQKAFSVLLGSVAAISLVVGGIGVMNIMLVSVTERTREIGVRMATGARRSDIMMQFNTEALVVGALGGLIGVLMGLGVSLALGATGMSIAITPAPSMLAFGSALAIGLLFGFMPARKASRLDPVIALASEQNMKRIFLSATALSLAACATASPPVSELTPMPASYDYAGELTAIEKDDALWWTSFRDAELDSLIEKALAANQDLAGGIAALKSARASVRVANASLFPQLSASASASSNTEGGGLDDVSASARGSASYQLDLFGQNRASRAAARAGYDAQVFDQRALELTVASDVAFTYFSVLAARERLVVARSNLEISERIFDIIETRYDAGDVSRFDVESQKASLANARARVPQIEQQLVSLETALSVLLGRTPQGYEAPEGDILAMTPPAINPGMPSELLLRRPDLLSAEAQLRAADANVAAAQRAFFPSIDLSAGANAGLTGGTSVIGSLAASLAAPIFTGGRLEGQLDSAEARVEQQIARYRQATLNALRDVDVSLSALATAEQREEQLVIARDAALQSLSLAEIRYRSGADNLTSLLNAQSTAFSASDSLVQGRLDRLSAAVDLYGAIGGGWNG